jgi:hypothetical protein
VRAHTALDVTAVRRDAFQELLAHLPGFSGTMEEIMARRMECSVDLRHDMDAMPAHAQEEKERAAIA